MSEKRLRTRVVPPCFRVRAPSGASLHRCRDPVQDPERLFVVRFSPKQNSRSFQLTNWTASAKRVRGHRMKLLLAGPNGARSEFMVVPIVLVGLIVMALFSATDSSSAAQKPSKSQFNQIRKALEGHLQQGYYCPRRVNSRISDSNRRWAMTQSRSNCGLGSQTVRHFVSRAKGGTGWKFRQFRYELLGSGQPVPCGSRKVPRDIRCGLRVTYSMSNRRAAALQWRQPRISGPAGKSLTEPQTWSTRWTGLFDETSASNTRQLQAISPKPIGITEPRDAFFSPIAAVPHPGRAINGSELS